MQWKTRETALVVKWLEKRKKKTFRGLPVKVPTAKEGFLADLIAGKLAANGLAAALRAELERVVRFEEGEADPLAFELLRCAVEHVDYDGIAAAWLAEVGR